MFPNSGSTFDLRALTLTNSAYSITDGDIPCTPENEPAFDYVWNVCANIPTSSIPSVCSALGKSGVALQYLDLPGSGACVVLGKYDPSKDDLSYSLIDGKDPSKGVALTYAQGDRCEFININRKATINFECANTKLKILSSLSDYSCGYTIVMKTYYGCPTVSPYINLLTY